MRRNWGHFTRKKAPLLHTEPGSIRAVNSEKRVIDFFRDQLRIKKEMDQQTGGAARLISGWNLESGGKIQIGEQSSGLLGEMALIDAQVMSEDKRMEYLQDRIKRAEDQRVREGGSQRRRRKNPEEG
jgi:hypothetical protein